MKTVIYKYITIAITSMVIFGGYSLAEDVKKSDDNSTKTEAKSGSNGDDENLPVIKLKVDNQTPSNPNLKKGKGCEDLEEAEGEVVVDIPDAETIPCDRAGGCENLAPAKLEPYRYKNIPTVQTDGSCEGDE
jgi:hypothetical protein